MGIARQPAPVKLILAVMYAEQQSADDGLGACIERFGSTDFRCGPLAFDAFTDYYQKESGAGLRKSYYSFDQLIDRVALPEIKSFTNTIEARLARAGKRTVNLDPGYLSNDKLVLASTKDFYHRIYLALGVYAEVTLHFRKGRFRHFSWTYPDYKDERVQEFLIRARAKCVGQVRGAGVRR